MNKRSVWALVLLSGLLLAGWLLAAFLPGGSAVAARPREGALLPTADAEEVGLSPIREISYYPRTHAWEKMWEEWPQAKKEVEEDLDRIQALGANTVRIFLHPSALGYPEPTAEHLADFEEMLALIDAHGLAAHVTLFDCWWSWQDHAGSQTWLGAVVGPHHDDTRIVLWELQNEVQLDNPTVRAWVQALFPYLKEQAGVVAATVSVANVEWLGILRDLTVSSPPDIYSLHWYPSSDLSWTEPFSATVDRARELIGPAELLIGEFGCDTCTFSEQAQANLYRDILYTADQQGVVHLGAWTLYDFPPGTVQCGGYVPPPSQLHFGLYRLDGSAKPAAALLQAAYHGNPPARPSPALILNSSFEQWNPDCDHMDDWQVWDDAWSGQQTFVQDCTQAHQGDCSAKVEGQTGRAVGLYTTPGWPVVPGRRYSLQGYVRTENLNGWAHLVFAWYDRGGTWLGNSASNEITEPNLLKWTRLHIDEVEPPPDAAYWWVFAQMSSTGPASYAWFDDVTTLVHALYLPLVLKDAAR